MKKSGEGSGNRSYKNSGSKESLIESSGPEGKVRGTAKQLSEKYVVLGRDSMSSGDRVAAERFFQHAEHYRRILIEKESNAPTFSPKKRSFPPQARQSKGQASSPNGESKEPVDPPLEKETKAMEKDADLST